MPRQKLFEYAVLYHPRSTKKQDEDGTVPETQILVAPKTILGYDDKTVGMRAVREVPDEYAEKLDRVEIIIRPF